MSNYEQKLIEPQLFCQDVVKKYGEGESMVLALKGVSFSIEYGEFTAIVGASGSGKSTLLQILGCLDRPTSGVYKLNGIDVLNLSDDSLSELRGQHIGFVFQDFCLLDYLTVIENVSLPLSYQNIPTSERLFLAEQALEVVGLSHRHKHFPSQLSGGEKQRTAIARAIVHKPKLLLADEPTGNLDTKVKDEILQHLQFLNEGQQMTVVMITHDDHTAMQARRTIRIQDGGIVR